MTTLLSFHADWCGPCSQQEPIVDEIEDTTDVSVEHYDIDTDDGMEMANEYSVRSVPTTIVLDDERDVIEQFVGLTDEDTIREVLD